MGHTRKTEKFMYQQLCILDDNKIAVRNSPRETLHATHPGAWVVTSQPDTSQHDTSQRDTSQPTKTIRLPLPPCLEPNEENQIDFGGFIIDSQGRVKHFFAILIAFPSFPHSNFTVMQMTPILKNFEINITQHGYPVSTKRKKLFAERQ